MSWVSITRSWIVRWFVNWEWKLQKLRTWTEPQKRSLVACSNYMVDTFGDFPLPSMRWRIFELYWTSAASDGSICYGGSGNDRSSHVRILIYAGYTVEIWFTCDTWALKKGGQSDYHRTSESGVRREGIKKRSCSILAWVQSCSASSYLASQCRKVWRLTRTSAARKRCAGDEVCSADDSEMVRNNEWTYFRKFLGTDRKFLPLQHNWRRMLRWIFNGLTDLIHFWKNVQKSQHVGISGNLIPTERIISKATYGSVLITTMFVVQIANQVFVTKGYKFLLMASFQQNSLELSQPKSKLLSFG